MGFPKRSQSKTPILAFDGSNPPHSTRTAHVCPRCRARVIDLPTTCNICNLPLVSVHTGRGANKLAGHGEYGPVRGLIEYGDVSSSSGVLVAPGSLVPPPVPRAAIHRAGRQGLATGRSLPGKQIRQRKAVTGPRQLPTHLPTPSLLRRLGVFAWCCRAVGATWTQTRRRWCGCNARRARRCSASTVTSGSTRASTTAPDAAARDKL